MRCGSSGTSGHVTAKSSVCDWGVLYKSGVYAVKALCLTPGGLSVVRADWESGDRLRSAGRSQQRAY